MTDWSGKFTIEQFYKRTKEFRCYPGFKNLIEMQLKFYDWWSKSNTGYIIRAFKNYPRARVYRDSDGVSFVSSDNEACCSFYEYTHQNGAYHFETTLFDLFKHNKKMKISYSKQSKPFNREAFLSDAKDYGFHTGGSKGEPFRSKYQLKLSHYLDAADGLDLNIGVKKRCGIFLSPLNIILTPKAPGNGPYYSHKARKDGEVISLNRSDIGETKIFKEFLHSFLIRDILEYTNGLEAYKSFCEMCELDYNIQLEENRKRTKESNLYEVEFISAFRGNADRKPPAKKSNYPIVTLKEDNINYKTIFHNSTRFYVTQKIYDDLLRYPDFVLYINVSPRKGNHPKGFYLLPNKVARIFIESKQGTPNWDRHNNFKQDSIPSDLTAYFTCT